MSTNTQSIRACILTFFKWLAFALLLGTGGGVVGAAFHICIEKATEFRGGHPWVLWLLPIGGVLIAGLYRVSGQEGKGTNTILDAAHSGKPVSILLLPVIFLSTTLTHLLGGSAGREGAALQIGGSLGQSLSRILRLKDNDGRIAVLCGMSALFSALFGTPLTAACFALEVVCVGAFPSAALLPCVVSALTAVGVTSAFGLEGEAFRLAAQGFSPLLLAKVAILSAVCGLLSIAFCVLMHRTEHLAAYLLPNVYLRAAVGGALLIGLSFLVGSGEYNGAGMNIAARAIEEGTARPEAFLLKFLFTAITLSCGFKGGEIVPLFYIGSTFACVFGPLLGIPAGFAAAIGLVSIFCGAVNCPLASIFLSIELFGSGSLVYFGLACAVSFLISGRFGLYSSQRNLFSKLSLEQIESRPFADQEKAQAVSQATNNIGR